MATITDAASRVRQFGLDMGDAP